MFFRRYSTVVIAVLLAFGMKTAQALDSISDRRGYFGALVGANIPTGSGANLTPALGITAGTKLIPELGVGIYGTYTGQTSSGNLLGLPAGTSTTNYNIAGELNFFWENFHLGADIGLGISSWSGSVSTITGGTSTNYLIFGPEAGFDIFLGNNLSLGADVHVLFNSQDSNVQNVQSMASIKLWI